ncbi:sushi nidogen and EGF-like domain-containing protein 1 [Sarcoptes scabiei]|nr:sushi nidogen and EGF-like domain-containing protein 1 [Sarcoptes scabiei]
MARKNILPIFPKKKSDNISESTKVSETTDHILSKYLSNGDPTSPGFSETDNQIDRKSDANQSKIQTSIEIHQATKVLSKQEYDYIKLAEISLMYPLKSTKLVSIYGVIHSYRDQIMTIMDETLSEFKFFPRFHSTNEDYDSSNLPFRIGDIIRIHRLALNPDYTRRSTNIKNIVVFESFSNQIFKPLSLASSFTIAQYDRDRVAALTRFSINKLINEPIIKETSENTSILHAAFLVLDAIDLDNRTIICCLTPNHFINKTFQSHPIVSFEKISAKFETNRSKFPFSLEILEKLYRNSKLIYIIIFGSHRFIAKHLNTSDVIIVYNLYKKPDRFYPGKYSYLLLDGDAFGQCLRVAESQSEIAMSMKNSIDTYFNDPSIVESFCVNSESSEKAKEQRKLDTEILFDVAKPYCNRAKMTPPPLFDSDEDEC